MRTPDSENRWGQDEQEPPDGVRWYRRERGWRCGGLTRRSAFFDRRGRHSSLSFFHASAEGA